ncbi:RhuM family protein [Dielma fastidiosa]|uniref:Virulence RhuM family protein n=1 Tax=Dielma fastidiosa TaxID=1034346 RepID=A0A318KQS2_9FIRM|nr:RhuM family protein [Dielma fastidiosa]PXX80099.1 virulence RhuM family protein [Dielma fastidiosa]
MHNLVPELVLDKLQRIWKSIFPHRDIVIADGKSYGCYRKRRRINAVSGETAAEVIYHRADAEKDFMGLMSFSGEQPTLREAKIAKNYLDEKELQAMGQLVSGY